MSTCLDADLQFVFRRDIIYCSKQNSLLLTSHTKKSSHNSTDKVNSRGIPKLQGCLHCRYSLILIREEELP
jgi:hypothetical protein